MAFLRFTSDEVKKSLLSAADKLGINDFHEEQEAALRAFLLGQDVFVNLPTCYGKSAIFQAAPFCWDFLCQTTGTIVIVVSPLSALMKDQIDVLSTRGIHAASLTKETTTATKAAIVRGEFPIVFASPEALAKSGRSLLKTDVYRNKLCGIFIDESHCIQKWGFGDGKVKAFRQEYSHLGELRSLVPQNVPVVALTATATATTRAAIVKSLALKNPSIVIRSPRRENIKYIVVKTKEKDIVKTLNWKLEGIRANGKEAERVIVYCRTKMQCNKLYAHFEHELQPASHLERYFAKFHAQTDVDVKDYILEAFNETDSHIRVLFATVAFGMGVDVKDLHTVIHYGPPHDIEEFVQESGRAGRDGKASISILVNFPGAGSITRPDQNVKEYMNSDMCRRASVFKHFDGDDGSSGSHHSCCDLCAKTCDCQQEDCKTQTQFQESLVLLDASQRDAFPLRLVTDSDRIKLRDHLIEFRENLMPGERDSHYLAGGDITCGFPMSTCNLVIEECNLVLTHEEFVDRYTFYENSVQIQVYEIVSDILQGCTILDTVHQSDSEDTTEEVSELEDSSECHRPVLFSSTDSD